MTKTKEKKPAILVDIHNTILNGNAPNQIILDVINRLSKIYAIIVFTADMLEDPKKVQDKLLQSGIVYDRFLYPVKDSVFNDSSDSGIKTILYKTIEPHYYVKLLIDNNKKVCRTFHKLGIDCMRFKEGEKNEKS